MVALPGWVQEGGIEPTLERLSDRAVRARLKSEWFSAPTPYALENLTIAMAAHPDWRWAEGLTVTAAAETAGLDPGDFVCDILSASGMAVGIVGFRPGDRTEADVRAILRHPAHMAGSDGIFCGGFPHPRGWGAFARYLGYHTRELGDYSWPEAVTHLTTHAARRFRLTDRGLIRPGFVADIVVLDPATCDRPSYVRRGPSPGRRGRARPGQWDPGPEQRRADGRDSRAGSQAGVNSASTRRASCRTRATRSVLNR